MYTIVFILVAVLILIGLSLFGLLISKLDKWIDRRERLGSQSIYKKQVNENSDGNINTRNNLPPTNDNS